MSSELVKFDDARTLSIRHPIALYIATGAPKPERGPGPSLPYFRFSPGQEDKYADAAETAREVYGDEPTVLGDLLFLANSPGLVLDIRLRAWSKAGLRGYGVTNYAAIPDEIEFQQRAWSYEDEFVFRPRTAAEVRKELRDEWQGESIIDTLTGPTDSRIKKLDINVEATLTFCVPKVMGLGTVALYSTKSRHNAKRLRHAVWSFYNAFGNLVGYPVQLERRPRKTERFDPEERAYKVTHVHETILKTAFTLDEVMGRIRERQDAIQSGARQLALPPGSEAYSHLLTEAMDLPLPADEPTRVREEPTEADRPTDAQLNRIAHLESRVTESVREIILSAFGVPSAPHLTAAEAERYETSLSKAAGVDETAVLEGEVVNEETTF